MKNAGQNRVKNLLVDTVTLLCKNGLEFKQDLRIVGVIGITLDDDHVFVVHIDENVSADSDRTPESVANPASIGANLTPADSIPGIRPVSVKMEPDTVDIATSTSAAARQHDWLQATEDMTIADDDPCDRPYFPTPDNVKHVERIRQSRNFNSISAASATSQIPPKTVGGLNVKPSSDSFSTFTEGTDRHLCGREHALPGIDGLGMPSIVAGFDHDTHPFFHDRFRMWGRMRGGGEYWRGGRGRQARRCHQHIQQFANTIGAFPCAVARVAAHYASSGTGGSSVEDASAATGDTMSSEEQRVRSKDLEVLMEMDRLRQERCRELNRIRVRRWRTKLKASLLNNEPAYYDSVFDSKNESHAGKHNSFTPSSSHGGLDAWSSVDYDNVTRSTSNQDDNVTAKDPASHETCRESFQRRRQETDNTGHNWIRNTNEKDDTDNRNNSTEQKCDAYSVDADIGNGS